MSNFYTVIRENPTRVFDPIIHQVVDSIISKIGMRKYLPDNNVNITSDREVGSFYSNPDGSNRYDTDYRLDVEVEVNMNPSADPWNSMGQTYNTPSMGMSSYWKNNQTQAFADPAVGFSAQEITTPCSISFRCMFKAPSYDAVSHVMGWIFTRSTTGSINENHDLVYSYPIDGDILSILYSVYKRRATWQAANPNANHLFDYIRAITQTNMSIDVRRPDRSMDSTNEQFSNEWQAVVKRIQMNCIGQLLTESQAPVADGEGDSKSVYKVEFTYQILFGRPHMLQFTIPPAVEQSLLPPIFFNVPQTSTNFNLAGAYQDLAFQKPAIYMNGGPFAPVAITRFPVYDDWTVGSRTTLSNQNFTAFLIGIVTIETLGSPTTVDLTELPSVHLSDFTKEILQMHTLDDFTNCNGLFNISVFVNDIPLSTELVTWNPQTLQYSFTVTDPTKVYRIVISEASDFGTIDPKWATVIANYRWYFPISIIRNLNYLVRNNVLRIGPGNKITAVIGSLRNNGHLWDVVTAMVGSGADSRIYDMMQTDGQLESYLCNTPWITTDPSTGDNIRVALYSLFVQTCVQKGFYAKNILPELTIESVNGYPYQVTDNGILSTYNMPLRVLQSTLLPASDEGN